MSENNEQSVPAADPPEEHLTPGGNPAQGHPEPDVETMVETPGGTTVTEQPVEQPENNDGNE